MVHAPAATAELAKLAVKRNFTMDTLSATASSATVTLSSSQSSYSESDSTSQSFDCVSTLSEDAGTIEELMEAEYCTSAQYGKYHSALFHFEMRKRQHIATLLTKGTRHEVNLFALLHHYVFPSTAEFLQMVESLLPNVDVRRVAALLSSTIRYHWLVLQAPEAEQTLQALRLFCNNTKPSNPKSVAKLEATIAQMEENERLSLGRLGGRLGIGSSSASGLLDFIQIQACFEEIINSDVAKILSFLDWKSFNVIPLSEYIAKRFQNADLSPLLHQSIQRFNRLTKWIATQILQPEDRTKRAYFLSRWIKIAQLLKERHNFSSLQMVVAALDHNNITRLRATWELIEPELVEQFQQLCELVTPRANYQNYRAALFMAPPNAIPIIPVFTKDLYQFEETLDTFLSGTHLNLDKLTRVFTVIKAISEYQIALEAEYGSSSVESTKLRFFERLDGLLENEDELYELSLKREPPGQFQATNSPSHKKSLSRREKRSAPSLKTVIDLQTGATTIPLRICVKGTTPAFTELGLSNVFKTLLLPLTADGLDVKSMLLERLCSTVTKIQEQYLRSEAASYQLYEERGGKYHALSNTDKPWLSKETANLFFERDRSLPKLSQSALQILQLQYVNGILEQKLQDAQAEIAAFKAVLLEKGIALPVIASSSPSTSPNESYAVLSSISTSIVSTSTTSLSSLSSSSFSSISSTTSSGSIPSFSSSSSTLSP